MIAFIWFESLKTFSLVSFNSKSFNDSSTSGIPERRSVIPLKRSWRGGVNFNEDTAIVARKGINSRNVDGFLFEIRGNNPMQKINVIPKGSTRALGNSGKVSAFHKNGYATFPAKLNFSVKNFSEPERWTSVMVLTDSERTLFIFDSRIILCLDALLIKGVTKYEISE